MPLSRLLLQAFGYRANYSASRHTLSQWISVKATRPIARRSSRLLAGAETARALSGDGAAGLRNL